MEAHWNTFKKTWIDRIEKKQSNLFDTFDSYITSEIWKDKEYINNIETILVINKKVDSISLKNKILYIYESPFYILSNNNKDVLPSGLIMETTITLLIKSIVNKSLSTIKVIKDYHFHKDDEEDEEEEEEEEAAVKATIRD